MSGRTKNLKPWPKGVSGNPGGRPKKKVLTEELERLLEEAAPKAKGQTWAAVIAEALVKKSEQGRRESHCGAGKSHRGKANSTRGLRRKTWGEHCGTARSGSQETRGTETTRGGVLALAYLRYWERRNIGGNIERKRVTHQLGPVTTRGKRPPADIKAEAERHMSTINSGTIPADRIVTISDFVEWVYLPWVELHKRPSTLKGYRDIWEDHLKGACGQVWLKDARTYHVQGWLNQIATAKLSRNTLKHIKSGISGIFTLAKQQDYFQGENPARDTAIDPRATEPQETYAYSLEELQTIISLLLEPAATAFAVAAFMGLRQGEIQGLLWEDYRGGEIYVSRSIWNGRVTEPKTRKGRAPIPVIRQLAERLEMHRLRCGNPQTGPIFANSAGKPLALGSIVVRVILPALNRCERCSKGESEHREADHQYKRDERIPEWHGWHAARRGLGSNLYRLGVPDKVIQAILRHANVSTTATYYIKTAADDVRKAMAKLENQVTVSSQTLTDTNGTLAALKTAQPAAIQ